MRIFSFFLTSFLCVTPLYAAPQIFEQRSAEPLFFAKLRDTKNHLLIGTFPIVSGVPPEEGIKNILQYRAKGQYPTTVIIETRLHPVEMRGGGDTSIDPLQCLKETGAHVEELRQFRNVHLKILLGDDFALISTGGVGENKAMMVRDFAVLLDEEKHLKELHDVMDCAVKGGDVPWEKYVYTVADIEPEDTRLSWGPAHHLAHIIDLIKGAKQSIDIYQQELQDVRVVNELRRQAENGLAVRVLMSHDSFGPENENQNLPHLKALIQSGAQVRLTGRTPCCGTKPLHIHAKVLITDEHMYVGSANFYPRVLSKEDGHLNLGIVTRNSSLIRSVRKHFEEDWKAHGDQP